MATYYVDKTTGDDGDDGLSEGNAWETLGKVNGETFSPGDLILLKRGEVWRESLNPPSSGDSTAQIVFSAYGTGDAPQINGADLKTTWALHGVHANLYSTTHAASASSVNQLFEDGTRLTPVAWDTDIATTYASMSAGTWTFDDPNNLLYCWASDDADPDTHAMEVTKRQYNLRIDDVEYVTFADLDLYICYQASLILDTAAEPLGNIYFQDCEAHAWVTGAVEWQWNAAARIGCTIRRNVLHDYAGTVIAGTIRCAFENVGGDIVVEHNEFYDGDHALWIRYASSLRVRYNYSHDNNDDFAYVTDIDDVDCCCNWSINDGDDGFDLQNCDDALVYNNLVALASDCGLRMDADCTGGLVKNNIFYCNRRGDVQTDDDCDIKILGTATLDYNLYYSDTTHKWQWGGDLYTTFNTWKAASGQDANSQEADPLFVDEANDDYHLSSSSPAIDAGEPVGLPYYPSAPDLGPFQWTPNFNGVDALRILSGLFEVQSLRAVGTIPGVIITHVAARNGPGLGRIKCQDAGTRLAWRAPDSSTFGTPVTVTSDGRYMLRDGEDLDKIVHVRVYSTYLEAGAESPVLLGDRYNNPIGDDDVTAAEATAGDVKTFAIQLENQSGEIMHRPVAWVDAAVSDIEISADNSAWVTPTSKATALELPDMAAGASDWLHIRRTIGAAENADPDVLNHLHFAFVSFG